MKHSSQLRLVILITSIRIAWHGLLVKIADGMLWVCDKLIMLLSAFAEEK